MKQYLLILLNVFFINSHCMGQKSPEQPVPITARTIENQASFDVFFTDQELKKEANQIFSRQDKFAPESQENKLILLCILPIDILKKILFDYLINTDPEITDEQEIYKNFKNLALTCKFFADLSKLVMAQIILISDKQIEPILQESCSTSIIKQIF